MEVRLSHRHYLPLPHPRFRHPLPNNWSCKPWIECKGSFMEHFKALAEVKKSGLPHLRGKGRFGGWTSKLDGYFDQKHFVMLATQAWPHAKSTGYFLVLVPLIAFCIRCIIGAFHAKAPRDSAHKDLNKSEGHRDGTRSTRWKHALQDIREPDDSDSESRSDSNSSACQDQYSFEDVHQAFGKLEHDYQKFLSDCGLNDSGYWQGNFRKHE